MRSDRSAPAVRRFFSRILPATAAAVTLVLAGTTGSVAAPPSVATTTATTTPMTGPQLAASWTGPLSTRGRYIVDANGNRFKLKAGNWAGAQGTWEGSGDVNDPANHQADQMSHNLPLGLDRAPMTQIMADFHELGLNSIRLPFANAMMRDTTVVPDSAVAANPPLKGKTPLQVFDAVVAALTAEGFAVILNNHTTSYRFCCGLDGNERWNSGQSAQQWQDDWLFLVNRYKANKRVVGADLRNEIRRDTWDDPNWGWGDDHDTYAAFELAGTRILQADPDMLVIMEGINWYGIPLDGLDYGRPMLTPVRELSNTLITSGKLVYAAHFYGYTGPNYTGADSGPGHTNDWPYEDFPLEKLKQLVHDEALFVTQSGQHFTAPVWISEFGAAWPRVAGHQGEDLVRQLHRHPGRERHRLRHLAAGRMDRCQRRAAGHLGPDLLRHHAANDRASATPVTGGQPTGTSWSTPRASPVRSHRSTTGTCSTSTSATTTSPPACSPRATGAPATARATAPTASA